MIKTVAVSFAAVLYLFRYSVCQDSTIPGEVVSYQTIASIGIEWPIVGDRNHNAQCRVRYRGSGASEWNDGLPLYRIDYNNVNMLAGSILFLDSSTEYRIELTLSDIDGGTCVKALDVATRNVPRMPSGGKTYHVAPGEGGGSGSAGDPFRGIEAAQNAAKPGDVFLLQSGNYSSDTDDGRIQFTVSGNEDAYIVWMAAAGANPVINGARMACHFIWLEGVTVRNLQYGILTESNVPEGIAITRCRFNGCGYGIYLNHGGKNWYITDNVIEGDIADYTTGAMGGEGVELNHSDGCVVAYNTIFNTADGVSYPGRNCDIFRNEIYNVSDDGIEFDYGYANNRAWENRITNANNNGISFQPMNGSPMYVIRNQVYVHEESALKLRDGVDRALIAHNTFVCRSGVVGTGANLLTGFQSNNNLWISVTDRYVWEDGAGSTAADWRTNLDYDGFDWNDNQFAFKWIGQRLASLEEFQAFSGLEAHGRRVRKNELFGQYSFPAKPAPVPLQYLTLKEACGAIDAGTILNGINDGYTGKAPDLGAFERGCELPRYGPRGGTGVYDHAAKKGAALPFDMEPNHFSAHGAIRYVLHTDAVVAIDIVDLTGRTVLRVCNRKQRAGRHSITIGTAAGVGVYVCRIRVGNHCRTLKLGIGG